MVIRKLNTVFARHGRIIFGVITIIIIISFMGFMQPGGSISDFFGNWGKNKSYGEIFGEAVSRSEVTEKINRDLILNDIRYNIGLNSYSGANKAEANAFSNLCLLAAARRRGIDASDKEIADFIFALAKFKNPETKSYDKKLYAAYIDGDLKANGFSATDLDAAVREDLITKKLQNELQNSVVIVQDEVREFYKMVHEKHYVSYAVFDRASVLKKIKVTHKEAKNYFAGNIPLIEDYMPGKSKVLLLEFKYDDPEALKYAAKQLNPKAIEDFYNQHKNQFMSFKKGQKPKAIPFAKVKAKAKKMLASRYAKKFASEKAAEFAEAAYDVVGDTLEKKQRKAFEAILAKFKYKAVSTDWFSDKAKKIGKLNEARLIREISILQEVPVSNAIAGKNAVYVAFIIDRVAPRPALFEEMKDKIIVIIKQQKALNMVRGQARELVVKLQKMSKAARLKSVATSKNPKFKSVKAFSLMSPSRGIYSNTIAILSRKLKNGEVAPAYNIFNGAIVVVLKKRIIPAMSGFAKKKKDMLAIYKAQKTNSARSAFWAWLQTKCQQNKPQ